MAALCTAAALGSGLVTAPPSAASGRVYVVSPGANLNVAMSNLNAGDRLLLRPGTYRTGYLRPTVHAGTASAPVVVTAYDSSQPPLLIGGLQLTNPNYWQVSRLRIQADGSGHSALFVNGGRGWRVTGSEFYGARYTGSFANVAISGAGSSAPSGFLFAANCVHDAALTHQGADQNVYVNFHGNSGSGGTIERNIIFNHPWGSGIKLGDGGLAGAPGPWNVIVRNNSIGSGGRQILLHGDIRSNGLYGNLLVNSTQRFTRSTKTTAIYVHDVVGAGNRIANTYVYGATMATYDPKGKLHNLGDTGIRPDPKLSRMGLCWGWQTAYPKAAAYGRYATGVYPRWS